jgi:hypothetical protein
MNLTNEDIQEIISLITHKGKIRATKPKVNRDKSNTGRAAYVWRMVRFFVGDKPADHCMPCTADFNLCDADWKNRKDVIVALDKLVDAIVDQIPKEQWHGIRRWGQAFGLIGSPMVADDGSIIYR